MRTIYASLALALVWNLPAVAAEPPAYLSVTQLEARYRLPASRFVEIDGHRIHYTDEGHGPVLVLLHGSSGSLRTYDGVVARLRAHYRVIRFDESNMGLSGPPPESLYIKPLYPVTVLEDLLAHLKITRASFVGVSSGGAIAFYFAARHPEMVDRLILSNTPRGRADGVGMAISADLDREIKASTPATGRKAKIYRPRSFWKAFFTFYTGEPSRTSDAQLDQYYDMNRRDLAPDALAIVTALDDADGVAKALARVTAPTLLLWGARDPILPPKTAQELAAGLVNAQVSTVMLPDVGHYPPLEVPARFAEIVESYLRDVTPVTPTAPPPAER